jgi:hypothetical protein
VRETVLPVAIATSAIADQKILGMKNICKSLEKEMRITTLLVVSLACLFAPARASAPAPHVVPVKVGLVLIGVTQGGFAVGADGSSLNADGRVSQEKRLFQAGKQSLLALAGSVSIQDPIGKRVREEINIGHVAGAWLAAHPDVDLPTADREVNAAVAAAVNKFLSTRAAGTESGAFKFGIVAAGFLDGKPAIIATRYFMPGAKRKTVRSERTSEPAKPGDMWIFGSSSVPMDLLTGKPNASEKFKADPAVRKFRSSYNTSLVEQDYLSLFDHILRAAESDQGRKLDGRRAIVAPPNRFATLTAKEGFSWSTVPN